MPNILTLKWGTLKAWQLETAAAQKILARYQAHGVSMSLATQRDTPEQQKALLDLIALADEIWLDWEDRQVSSEDARLYVLDYRKGTEVI